MAVVDIAESISYCCLFFFKYGPQLACQSNNYSNVDANK